MMFVSENYQDQLKQIHSTQEWGSTGKGYWKKVDKIASILGTNTFLDYGAGHGSLRKKLEEELPSKYIVKEYEPGIPEKSSRPDAQDFVVCCDVLEHVEPDLIDNVLDELKRVTLKKGLFTVSCRLANRKLPDGRNAHLIVESVDWWNNKLQERFNIIKKEDYITGGLFLVEPL